MVIYNPKAGNSEGDRVGKLVEDELRNKGIEFSSHATKDREDLINFIETNAVIYNKIIVIGGDGTIRDAITAMNRVNWPCPIGIIPAGSGNDLARLLGKNIDPIQLINQYLITTEEDRIYGAHCNDKSFINVLGAGINTSILKKRAVLKNIFGRQLSYLVASLMAMLFYSPKHYELTIDGKDYSDHYYIIAVCNGKYFGAGMKIFPDADLKSDQLAIVALKKVSRFKLLKAFMKIYKGEHIHLDYVDYHLAKNIQIRFEDEDDNIDLDGDLFSVKNILITKTQNRSIRLLKHN